MADIEPQVEPERMNELRASIEDMKSGLETPVEDLLAEMCEVLAEKTQERQPRAAVPHP
jgi:hypothetical protein